MVGVLLSDVLLRLLPSEQEGMKRLFCQSGQGLKKRLILSDTTGG